MTVGERIKKRRKELKMSADELGKRLGKDRSTVFRYENGYIEKLPVDALHAIAEALKTTPEYLMGWEEVQKKNNATADIVLRLRSDEKFLSAVKTISKLSPEQLASITQMANLLLKG